MELLLQEIKRIPYARNMYIFKNGIYFNTILYKAKLDEDVHKLNEGVFKFEHGSIDEIKVYDKLIQQFFVNGNELFILTLEGQVFNYNLLKNELNEMDYNIVSYDYLNKQGVLCKVNRGNNVLNRIERVVMYYQEEMSIRYDDFEKFIKDTSLHFEEKEEGLFFIGKNQFGEIKWSVNVNKELDVEKSYFLGQDNHIDNVYSIRNEYWIIYFQNNTILMLNGSGTIEWFELNGDYDTYNFEDNLLYARSSQSMAIIDSNTGFKIKERDLKGIKETYNSKLHRGGLWIYEDFIFLPTPKESIEWLVFNKHTLEDVGLMKTEPKDDETVLLPGGFCSNFIYSKGKVYINDTADWLRVYDVEFREE